MSSEAQAALIGAGAALLVTVGGYFFVSREHTEKLQQDYKEHSERMQQEQKHFLANLMTSDEQLQKTRAKEFHMKYYEKQLDFLNEFCDTAGRIADAGKLDDVKADIALFRKQSNFLLVMFGDCELRSLAVKFMHNIEDKRHNQPLTRNEQGELSHAVYNIGRKCRDIIGKTYRLDDQEQPCFDPAPSHKLKQTNEPSLAPLGVPKDMPIPMRGSAIDPPPLRP